MRRFKADEAPFKEREWKLSENTRVKLRVPAGTECVCSAITAAGNEVELLRIAAAVETVERLALEGFATFKVAAKKAMLADVTILDRQIEEPHNDLPVPEPEVRPNMLQRIRENVRQQMGVQREAFLDSPRGIASYELPDDAPDEFEEELMEKVDKAQKESEEKAAKLAAEKDANERRQSDTGADTGDSPSSERASSGDT